MKQRLSIILGILLHLQNRLFMLKKINSNSLLAQFWKFARKSSLKSSSDEKDVLNYIISKNMSRTLRPSNMKNEIHVSTKHGKENIQNSKGILHFISFNWKKSKQWFFIPILNKSLKFHMESGSLGNLASKYSTGKKEETEENWGGPEAFKLITFIKNNFNEFLEKNPSVLVMFSAYWCPHCARLKKHFGAAAIMAKNAKMPVMFVMFDVTDDPDIADEKGVVGIPTIKYYNNGKLVSTYRGKRTAEDLFEFVKNPSAMPKDVKKADI